MGKTNFFEKIKEFDKFDYTNFSRDWAMVYVVNFLIESKVEPLLDEISVASFKLFPKQFSLISFPQYPDVRTVANTLWHCKDKQKEWLIGNDKSGYKLTEKGKVILENFVQNKKEFQRKKGGYKSPPNRKEVYFIELIKKSQEFKNFLNNKKFKYNKDDVKKIAMCTKDASNKIVLLNLSNLREYAKRLNEREVITFINYLEKIHKNEK